MTPEILAAIVSQNSFVLVFVGYRTILARYVAKWGIAQMCLCETKYHRGYIAPFWGSANLPEKASRDMGYRSDSIAVSRDMGPLPKGPFRTKIPYGTQFRSVFQERKISPKRKFFGTDAPRTSGGHLRGYPGPKLRSGWSKSWKNKHLGVDIHDPKARTSMTLRDFQKLRSEKLWAEFSFRSVLLLP